MPEITLPGVGAVIDDRYEITATIGRGGTAAVYEAFDTEFRIAVAVKLMVPIGEDLMTLAERTRREATALMRLDHPHTLRVITHGVHAASTPLPYIVMERLFGTPLDVYMANRGPMTVRQAGVLLRATLGSLSEAHTAGILHRDIKPSNLFLVDDDPAKVKVLDFGVANMVAGEWSEQTMARLTETGFAIGTPRYMAPEIFAAKGQISAAIDIYALGCVGFLMIAGKPPYDGTPTRVALRHMQDPTPELPKTIHEGLRSAIYRAMAKTPCDRYADAGQMLAAIEPLVDQLSDTPLEWSCEEFYEPTTPEPIQGLVEFDPESETEDTTPGADDTIGYNREVTREDRLSDIDPSSKLQPLVRRPPVKPRRDWVLWGLYSVTLAVAVGSSCLVMQLLGYLL